MIHYFLRCDQGCEFDAWFGSIADCETQLATGQVQCPTCGSTGVEKAPMAPAIVGKAPSPRAVAMAMAAQMKNHIRDNFDYVGDRFADEARKIHDGETPDRPIWGEATADDARSMMEDGLDVAPLPPALAPTPPKALN